SKSSQFTGRGLNVKSLLSRGAQALCLVAATAVVIPSVASAQKADPSGNTAQNGSGASAPQKKDRLDEIGITARKKAENLEDTPLAVTALTGEKLEEEQVTNLSQVADFAPNLTFDTSAPLAGGSSAASIYIRGVGSQEFSLATDP